MRGGGFSRGRGGGRGGFYANGRGNHRGGGMVSGHPFKHGPKPFVPYVLFDFVQAERSFQRVKPVSPQDDILLNDALIKRNQDLTPADEDMASLLSLVTQTQTILDNLILTPGDFDACQIEDIKQVGSYKKGTMMVSNKIIADICVVLKTLPTKEAVNQLANKVFEEIKKAVTETQTSRNLQVALNDTGFEIHSGKLGADAGVDVAVQVRVTTLLQNLRILDPALHLDSKQCHTSFISIKHTRWFEENASQSSIKVLVRLLKDMRSRFEGLSHLTSWMIDLMAHHAVMNNPNREALPLAVAFRRIFQLIAAGFFLPGSAGIIDPCENSISRVHTTMTLEQQDSVCFTFQTLLRVLAHGGLRQILGLEGNASIATDQSMWGGIVVIPSARAYEQDTRESDETTGTEAASSESSSQTAKMDTN